MATLVEALAERTAAQRAPIAGAAPGGEDLSFDTDFGRVKAEIDKLSSVDGQQPNWRELVQVGDELLGKRTKDMRVATWVAVGKMNQSGWPGLAEGLVVYHALVKDFWDTMFPDAKRARGRANLYTWLGDQVAALLEPKDVTLADGEAVKASDELFTQIEAILSEKLGDLHPGPGKIRGLMRDKVRSIPVEEVAAPEPAPGAAQAAAPAAAAMPTFEAPTVTSVEDAGQAVRAVGRGLMDIAGMLRRADPADAWSYRLQRTGAWVGVRQPPPADGAKTRIPPPGADIAKRWELLMTGEKWVELINAAEEATGTYLFWMDAHRMVATAMDRLGALFIGAREVLGREVVGFLSRFPTVPTLTFSDGKPFADPGTRSWLDEELKKWGGGSGGGGNAAVSAEDEEVQKRFEEAKGLVSGGKVPDGLALAVALANRAADGRMRFRAHLTVARLALEGGKPEVAKPMLEALLAQVDQHALETWEPTLCASLYANLLASLKALPKDGKSAESQAREGFVFDKLCRLDPAAALRLTGS